MQLTVASFVKAVLGIAVRGEDGDFVAEILQADCGVDYETLGTANAQVRVEEDDAPALDGHFFGEGERRARRCWACVMRLCTWPRALIGRVRQVSRR